MWLVGVVIRRYIDILKIIINFPYSTCIIRSFFTAASLLLFSFLKCFFGLVRIRIRIRNRNGDFLTSRGAHVNCAIMAMLYTHAIGNQP